MCQGKGCQIQSSDFFITTKTITLRRIFFSFLYQFQYKSNVFLLKQLGLIFLRENKNYIIANFLLQQMTHFVAINFVLYGCNFDLHQDIAVGILMFNRINVPSSRVSLSGFQHEDSCFTDEIKSSLPIPTLHFLGLPKLYIHRAHANL